MLHRSERRAKDFKNVDDQEQFRITDQNADWSEQIKKKIKKYIKKKKKKPQKAEARNHMNVPN